MSGEDELRLALGEYDRLKAEWSNAMTNERKDEGPTWSEAFRDVGGVYYSMIPHKEVAIRIAVFMTALFVVGMGAQIYFYVSGWNEC